MESALVDGMKMQMSSKNDGVEGEGACDVSRWKLHNQHWQQEIQGTLLFITVNVVCSS
jgi:hypothetical protein